jgi:hypothetical protein
MKVGSFMFKNKSYILFFISIFISLLFLFFVNPDFFFYRNIRFTSGHDISQPFFSSFIITENIFNKDFDNWNIFDQVNHSYHHLTSGLYTLPALLESLFFLILKNFTSDQAILFHLTHTYSYQILCLIFRSLGAILILNLYRVNFFEKIFFVILLNTLYSVSTISGVMVGFIYSLMPIAIYFIIKIDRDFKLKDILLFLLFLSFIFSQAPLMTISYFYLPLHFCIIFLICKKIKKLKEIKLNLSLKNFIKFLIFFSFVLYIIFFNFKFYNILDDTTSLHEISENENRLKNFLNYKGHFNLNTPDHINFTFFSNFINYQKNAFNISGNFIGIISLILFFIGTFKSKLKERWIFFMSTMLIFFLLGSRVQNLGSFSYFAHLLNFATNPFSALIRDTHMSYLLIQYLIFPNVVMGYIFIKDSKSSFKFSNNIEFYIFLVFFLFLIFSSKMIITEVPKYSFFILVSLLLLYFLKKLNKTKSIICLIFLLFLVDILLLKSYFKYIPYIKEKIILREFENKEKKYLIDYQNPLTKNLSLDLINNKPLIKKRNILEEEKYIPKEFIDIYFNDQTYFGFFWKNIFNFRLHSKEKIYELRHKSYKGYKINETDDSLFNFYEKNGKKKKDHYINKSLIIKKKDIKFYKSEQNYNIYYLITPKEIKSYNYTNIFNKKNQTKLLINNISLKPIQNNISEVNEFDLNNFKENTIFFSLKKKEIIDKIEIIFKEHELIKNINIRNSNYKFYISNLEELNAIIKFPYDKNWNIQINNLHIPFSQHEGKWIKINIPEGNNAISIKYDLNKYFINNFTIITYFATQILIIIFLLHELLFQRNKENSSNIKQSNFLKNIKTQKKKSFLKKH